MSQLSKVIFGVIAVSLTSGAVQLAVGRDLAGTQDLAAASEAAINRTAKTDRAVAAVGAALQTRTISLRVDALSDTSILIRVPVAKEIRNVPAAPSMTKPSNRKATVACEPVVSVLTEVAKQLQPGRCVT